MLHRGYDQNWADTAKSKRGWPAEVVGVFSRGQEKRNRVSKCGPMVLENPKPVPQSGVLTGCPEDRSRTLLHNPYRSCRAQRAGPKPAYFTAFASEAPANCGHTHALKFSERVLGTIFTVGADVRRPESQGFQHGSEPPHVGSYNFKTRCQPATLRRSVGGVSPSARPFVSCFTFVPDPSLIGNIGVLIYRTSPRPNAELS